MIYLMNCRKSRQKEWGEIVKRDIMPKNKYESRYVMNKNITDMKAAIKNTVREVDIPRYMGVWHEIARYENHFEKIW